MNRTIGTENQNFQCILFPYFDMILGIRVPSPVDTENGQVVGEGKEDYRRVVSTKPPWWEGGNLLQNHLYS